MILYQWAQRHGIPLAAIKDLESMLGMIDNVKPEAEGLSEAAVQVNIRLKHSRSGARLFRNNVGGFHDEEAGTFIRYGLANESEKMNKTIKSGDLIGITPVTITPQMVGYTFGLFTSIEAKKQGWQYSASEHEQAQLRWIQLILSLGGYAAFDAGDI